MRSLHSDLGGRPQAYRPRQIERLVADLRYAVRHFRRTPLSTTTMVLALSLGIGTNVLLFTVLNSLATLPPPGIPRDASLVRIRGTTQPAGSTAIRDRQLSWPEVQEYAGRTDLFSSVAAHADETGVVGAGEVTAAPVPVHLIFVTPNYFKVLKVHPVLGTEPAPERDGLLSSSSPVAVISHAMWQQRFGGAPDVIGRTLRVNDFPVEIVGVAPPRFVGTGSGGAMTLWIPLGAYPLLQQRTPAVFLSYDSTFLSASAQLRAGIAARSARATVAGIAERTFQLGPGGAALPEGGAAGRSAQPETGGADVVPMLASNQSVGDRTDALVSGVTAGGIALLALLITGTNVSALLVGLAVARRREIALRLSLGATRARLIRQLLTEAVLLACIAGAIGLFATAVGLRLSAVALADVQLVVDWRVTAATSAVALVTGILFGLSPALHATRLPVGEVLKSAAAPVTASRSRLQRALVVAQITLTQPLLVGLGVVIATMVTDMKSRPASGVAGQIAELELDLWATNLSAEDRASRVAAVVERVAAMPGVVAAMPMQMGTITAPLAVHPADRIPGVTYDGAMQASLKAAPKGYFNSFEIRIVRGRDFEAREYVHSSHDATGPLEVDRVIVGSDLARRLWRDADPLGRRLTLATAERLPALVVVGVVDELAAGPSDLGGQISVYVPYAPMNTGVMARTEGPAQPMLNAMRRAVAAEAPHLPISRVETLEQREAEIRRKLARASGAAAAGGLIALLLSAIGLYAVVSFAVGQHTREIGIRTALGARPGQVVRRFFARGLVLSVTGLILGLPLSMIVIQLIGRMLRWPLASLPLLGGAIGAVVLAVASVAAWLPARRASAIDPMVALRSE